VTREFYYNDAGVQIATLAHSTQCRLKGLKPGDAAWPEAAYNGDYIQDIADGFRAGQSVKADDREFTASGDLDDLPSIQQFAVAYLRHEQDLDLQAFGLKFDSYFLESSLYENGGVEATVARLTAAGKTFEEDGALWLRSTDYGDDKDRVMRKSAGGYTYFVPDVAYHINKFQRGYTQCINVQGSDHHGTIARVRAGLQAADVGIPQGFPDYVLHKMVTVMKGGEEVKISKRAGSYVTLRDLIDWTSRDAVRFFLIGRKADTEFIFDIDLALKQNDENPVFYVQYAHARICSVLRNWVARGGDEASLGQADLSLLTAPTEAALMLKLADYPRMLSSAAETLAPHDVAFYLRDLAGAYHSYYAAERVLDQTPELSQARAALLAATRQVIANALAVLGVSAPTTMNREISKRLRRNESSHEETGAARRLRAGPDRGPAAGLGGGVGRGAIHHQSADPLHQQGAAAHRRAGRRGDPAQQELGPERAAGRQGSRQGRQRFGQRLADGSAPRRACGGAAAGR
ncbi:arginine--tRNA ligase, partial [Roseateles sp. GG27B]